MVMGHSNIGGQFNHIFGFIRMPCFFLVSGFLLKDKYFSQPFAFLKRRLKGLYWPYVKWSLLFLVCNNLFVLLHLCSQYYTWKETLFRAACNVCFAHTHPLLGGYWFLQALFFGSVMAFSSLFVLKKKAPSHVKAGSVLVALLFILLDFFVTSLPYNLPDIINKSLLATSFYLVGYWFNLQPFSKKSNLLVGVLCILTVVAVSFYFVESIDARAWRIVPFFVVALIGSYGFINIAGYIKGWARKTLDYIGTKTLYILTFHFISFKLVSLIKIWQYKLPISALSDFPVISEHNTFYRYAYCVVGVALPVIIWEVTHSKRLKKPTRA